MEEKIKALDKEIRAIKLREKGYVEQGNWDLMVPWFDLTENERANAILYWGEE